MLSPLRRDPASRTASCRPPTSARMRPMRNGITTPRLHGRIWSLSGTSPTCSAMTRCGTCRSRSSTRRPGKVSRVFSAFGSATAPCAWAWSAAPQVRPHLHLGRRQRGTPAAVVVNPERQQDGLTAAGADSLGRRRKCTGASPSPTPRPASAPRPQPGSNAAQERRRQRHGHRGIQAPGPDALRGSGDRAGWLTGLADAPGRSVPAALRGEQPGQTECGLPLALPQTKRPHTDAGTAPLHDGQTALVRGAHPCRLAEHRANHRRRGLSGPSGCAERRGLARPLSGRASAASRLRRSPSPHSSRHAERWPASAGGISAAMVAS